MKSQTDLIVVVVASIFTIGAAIGLWFTKRDSVVLSAPTEVTLTTPALPAGDVVMADSLPGGSSSAGGGGGSRGGMGGGMGGGRGMGPGMSMGPGGGGMGGPRRGGMGGGK